MLGIVRKWKWDNAAYYDPYFAGLPTHIKRFSFGLGLKESKDWVDMYLARKEYGDKDT